MDKLIEDIKKKQNQVYKTRDYVEQAICLYEHLDVCYNSQKTKEIKEVYVRLGEYLGVVENNLNTILYED